MLALFDTKPILAAILPLLLPHVILPTSRCWTPTHWLPPVEPAVLRLKCADAWLPPLWCTGILVSSSIHLNLIWPLDEDRIEGKLLDFLEKRSPSHSCDFHGLSDSAVVKYCGCILKIKGTFELFVSKPVLSVALHNELFLIHGARNIYLQHFNVWQSAVSLNPFLMKSNSRPHMLLSPVDSLKCGVTPPGESLDTTQVSLPALWHQAPPQHWLTFHFSNYLSPFRTLPPRPSPLLATKAPVCLSLVEWCIAWGVGGGGCGGGPWKICFTHPFWACWLDQLTTPRTCL